MEQEVNVGQATGGEFFDIDKTTRDISQAFDTAERTAQIGVGRQTEQTAQSVQQGLARYGGEAFDTGASKKAMADIFTDMNVQIANITNQYALNRTQQLISANQYFTDLASRGIIDPATGSFLKSTFNMQVELNDQQFQNQLKLLREQGKMQEQQAMWGGLGTLAGMAFTAMNPGAGIIASLAGGKK